MSGLNADWIFARINKKRYWVAIAAVVLGLYLRPEWILGWSKGDWMTWDNIFGILAFVIMMVGFCVFIFLGLVEKDRLAAGIGLVVIVAGAILLKLTRG